ncbi:TIGR00645 family protein [Endozoicomonas arenosclerae]|uniref:TIGR00645 family protein n=1 Tax=Endozoicomonas arenosclerae TaxID=1633495 RepID=UPI0007812548|nr:TIGR00645 family protein [Endozoicomonas arenosclerae]
MERLLERVLYSARWLLAPMYLGLSLVLIVLLIEFYQGVLYLAFNVLEMAEHDVTLKVLTLIDVVLVAGLIVMVMYSGYENFVSKLDIDEDTEKLSWLGKMDSSSLKAKLAASIVAISSIQLLKVFMNAENITNDKLLMNVVMHMTFVISALLMGFLDHYGRKKPKTNGVSSPVSEKLID